MRCIRSASTVVHGELAGRAGRAARFGQPPAAIVVVVESSSMPVNVIAAPADFALSGSTRSTREYRVRSLLLRGWDQFAGRDESGVAIDSFVGLSGQGADSLQHQRLGHGVRRCGRRRLGQPSDQHVFREALLMLSGCMLLDPRSDSSVQGDDGDHDQHHDATASSPKWGSMSYLLVALAMITTPKSTPTPRSGYRRMTFQKPAPAPKWSTQSPVSLAGTCGTSRFHGRRVPVVVEPAHAARRPRGENEVPVEFTVVQVHAQEPARVHDVADQSAVGGPVDVEGIQCQEGTLAVAGDPVG